MGLGIIDLAEKNGKIAVDLPLNHKFCEKEECDEAYFTLGQIYEYKKMYEEALKCYEKAISIEDENKYLEQRKNLIKLMKNGGNKSVTVGEVINNFFDIFR